MKIFLHEVNEQEMDLDFSQEDPWVATAVHSVDERSDTHPESRKARPIGAHMSLRKVDEVVVVSGKIDTYIELICSRCATPFHFTCKPKFSALFCKDPLMAGVAHLHRQGQRDPGVPVGQNQGFARHAHDYEGDEAVAQGKDLDITYLSHDYIDLSDVLKEQLQLQVPFQPLCKETCKGICSHCGAELNVGKCACAKIKTTHPFSVLRDFKV